MPIIRDRTGDPTCQHGCPLGEQCSLCTVEVLAEAHHRAFERHEGCAGRRCPEVMRLVAFGRSCVEMALARPVSPSRVSASSLSGVSALRTLIAKLQRYDLVANFRCGGFIDEMEPSDYGDWVRWDELEAVCVAQEKQRQEETDARGGGKAHSSDSPTAMEKGR